ncbi:PAS domain-containing protein [Candidatus Auribacterota bacterium]
MKKTSGKKRTSPSQITALRKRAEKVLRSGARSVRKMQGGDIKELIHELRVYQVELEMQNAELASSRQIIEDIKDRYFDLYNLAPCGYITLDGKWRITEANLTAARKLGCNRNALEGRSFHLFVPKESTELFYGYRKELLSAHKGQCEMKLKRLDGGEFYAGLESAVIAGGKGRPLRTRVIMTDVTRRRVAQEEQRLANERFMIISRSTSDVTWDWDLVTDRVWWNEQFKSLFGYGPGEIEQRIGSWQNRLHPDDAERVLSGIRAVIDGGGKHWSDEYRFLRKDGSYCHIYDRGSVIHDSRKRPVRMTGSMQDITERKLAEEAKNELIRDLSHSIKTPLAMISMGLQIWKQGIAENDKDLAGRAEQIVRNNMVKASRDIDNILNLFTLGLKKTELEKEVKAGKKKKSSLKALLEEYRKNAGLILEIKKLELNTDIPRGADRVPMDAKDLKIVMENLLDNAVKFTRKGAISVSGRLVGGYVRIRVEDTGCGITDKENEMIFERFRKLNPSADGTGLGLSICRGIVDMYKGRIEAASLGKGRGMAVTITLPVKKEGNR